MLAADWDELKLTIPPEGLIAQPKIDGVRGLNLYGYLTGRSLKKFGNRYTTDFFSKSAFVGFDGELAAADERDPALCRLTTSALSTHKGEPFMLWWLFDYITANTMNMPYIKRYNLLHLKVSDLQRSQQPESLHLRIVPFKIVKTIHELNNIDAQWLDDGYEGTIIRRLNQPYKYGRSTIREGGLLRIKRFTEEEAVVNSIVEGQSNQNEAVINALGQTERSTHQANMVPNSMVGALECTDINTGKPITVAAGTAPHDLRKAWFDNPSLILKQTIKYKTFPKGVKDKPRFPTFQSIKLKEDM